MENVEKIVQYISFFAFFLLGVIAVLIETNWLKKTGNTHGRSLMHSLVSDILGFSIGGLVVLVVMLLLLMMAFGPSGTGSNASELSYVIVLSAGALATPVTLFLAKRVSMLLFKISTRSPWRYSLVSAVLTFLAVLVPPPLFYYAATRFI